MSDDLKYCAICDEPVKEGETLCWKASCKKKFTSAENQKLKSRNLDKKLGHVVFKNNTLELVGGESDSIGRDNWRDIDTWTIAAKSVIANGKPCADIVAHYKSVASRGVKVKNVIWCNLSGLINQYKGNVPQEIVALKDL